MVAPNKPTISPLTWERDVPLLTHPAILNSIAKLWIITSISALAFLDGTVGWQQGIKAVVPITTIMLMFIGGLFVVSLLILLIVLLPRTWWMLASRRGRIDLRQHLRQRRAAKTFEQFEQEKCRARKGRPKTRWTGVLRPTKQKELSRDRQTLYGSHQPV
jgi:hypothetical protein